MAKSSSLYVRIEPEIKEEAEKVLTDLGMSMSSAVNIFLKQVVLRQGIPFSIQRNVPAPKSIQDMSQAEFDATLQAGYADYLAGNGRPARQVLQELREEYGV